MEHLVSNDIVYAQYNQYPSLFLQYVFFKEIGGILLKMGL